MIDDVIITPLKIISDERGAVLLGVCDNDSAFSGFSEQYFSEIKQHLIKGWKKNDSVDQLFVVPWGDIKLVLYDNRGSSPTSKQLDEIIIGRSTQYAQVKIPKNIWYAFQALSVGGALVSNIIPIAHKQCVADSMPLVNDVISYNWKTVSQSMGEIACD